MGRSKKHNNRQQAHVYGVLALGGSRRTFLLSPAATKGLKRWRERIGATSDRDAIEQAILAALMHVRGSDVLATDRASRQRPVPCRGNQGAEWCLSGVRRQRTHRGRGKTERHADDVARITQAEQPARRSRCRCCYARSTIRQTMTMIIAANAVRPNRRTPSFFGSFIPRRRNRFPARHRPARTR